MLYKIILGNEQVHISYEVAYFVNLLYQINIQFCSKVSYQSCSKLGRVACYANIKWVSNKFVLSKLCLLRFAKMKDNSHCPVSTSIEFKYSLNVESYIRRPNFNISFCFNKDMVSSQKCLCLCASFAHHGNMEVKIHKTWITIDNEACFSLNCYKTNNY